MKIKIISEKNLWQKFFDDNCSSSFLHSWEWGEFQQSLGYPIIRLGLFNDKNQLEAISLVIKIKSRRGNFLFVPHGPIIVNHLTSNTKHIKKILFELLKFLKEIAKRENYWFIRIAPIFENKNEYQKIFSDLGFKKAPIYMHAETTWELPLINKTEEELLSSMRKTTRYLIKKAARDGVLIEKTEDPKALKIFYNLYQETAKREKFIPFSFDFIKKEFAAFSKSKNAMIFLAVINNKKPPIPVLNDLGGADSDFTSEEHAHGSEKRGIKAFIDQYLAASIIIFTKSAAFYHQGASLHTKIPATYLLQWEAIKEAKNRGCLIYNFWGIYDEQRPERTPKSWQGLTLFKTGFSGQIKRFLETQDYIISKKYYLTYLWEKFLMWKRLK
jgi:lipid II:glycine glycyltransferase (peptidoglycan interpeptide bridge formation enzyme)